MHNIREQDNASITYISLEDNTNLFVFTLEILVIFENIPTYLLYLNQVLNMRIALTGIDKDLVQFRKQINFVKLSSGRTAM